MTTRRIAAVLAALLLGGAAAGCGGDDGDSGGEATSQPTSDAPAEVVSEVGMSDDFKFSPSTVAAKSGSTITVKNTGNIQHDLKLRQGGKEVGGTPLVDGGKSAELKVDVAAGDYEMFCSVPGHEQGGMKGTFTVQ